MPDPESQTIEVRPAHRFDEVKLARYLAGQIAGLGGEIRVRQFPAGQSNPTFLLETAAGRLVLRKKPPGTLLPSAHQIEREYRILSALYSSAVPVPRPILLCEDPSVIGTGFYVMAHVEGRIIPRPELGGIDPVECRQLFAAMIDTLAALHRVDWQAAGLAGFGKTQNYLGRQVERWSAQYQASIVEGPDPAMEALTEWLHGHLPKASAATIAHGDFRIGNLIYAPDRPQVMAVLDWELSTLGDPLSDLAYCCLPYHLPGDGGRGFQGFDLMRLGIPSEAEQVQLYCRLTGRKEIADWTYYLAFSLFRLAAICHGVYARGVRGNASAANALEIGRRATLLSETGWKLARGGR